MQRSVVREELKVFSVVCASWFRYKRAKRGPRTEPWGQPALWFGKRMKNKFWLGVYDCVDMIRSNLEEIQLFRIAFRICKYISPKCQILFKSGLRSRSRSRTESVVFPGVGVGVGVDKIYRLRPTPAKNLFPIHRNRHADYNLKHFFAHIFVVDWLDD